MKNQFSKALGVAASLALAATVPIASEAQTAASKPQQAVLVTGASTGIGRKIAEKLAADGYFVYAGARKEADLQALGAIKNVQAVRLDVTSAQDINAAVETISKGGRGLYGLVNNAGVATAGSFADMKPDEFDLIMAVNVYGPYRVTKSFAPLIITQKGRIVTIGSLSGILSGRTFGAYAMSKHAMEAFTDSLALQMSEFGVKVSIVEPGNYNSEILKNAVDRGVESLRAAAAEDPSHYKEPDDVADAVEKALFEATPKHRYMVVPIQNEAERTIRKQLEQLVQLNEGQPYTFERNALVKMLDEALAGSRPKTKQP